MIQNLEEGRMSLDHCAPDGKAMGEDTKESQLRGPRGAWREGGRGKGGGGRGEGDLGNTFPL